MTSVPNRHFGILLLVFFLIFSGCSKVEEAEQPQLPEVAFGKQVALFFSITLDDGSIFESNVGKDPMVYSHGSGQLLPSLEEAMLGMKKGEQKTFALTPEQAFGPVNPEAIVELPLTDFDPDAQQVGRSIIGATGDGRPLRGTVVEVGSENVKVDFNHVLAGKTLHYDITVVDVQ